MTKTISSTPITGRWTIVVPPLRPGSGFQKEHSVAGDIFYYTTLLVGDDPTRERQIMLLAQMVEQLATFASTGEASLLREATEALIYVGILRFQPEPAPA